MHFADQILVKFDISPLVEQSLHDAAGGGGRAASGIVIVLNQELPDAPWMPLPDVDTLTIHATGRATLRVCSFAKLAVVWFSGEDAAAQAAHAVAEALRVASQQQLIKTKRQVGMAVGQQMMTSDDDDGALQTHGFTDGPDLLQRIALAVSQPRVSESDVQLGGLSEFAPVAAASASAAAHTSNSDASRRSHHKRQLDSFYSCLLGLIAPPSEAIQRLQRSFTPATPRILGRSPVSTSAAQAASTPVHVALRQLARSTLLHALQLVVDHDQDFEEFNWDAVMQHLDSATTLELMAYCRDPGALREWLEHTEAVRLEQQLMLEGSLERNLGALVRSYVQPREPSIAESASSARRDFESLDGGSLPHESVDAELMREETLVRDVSELVRSYVWAVERGAEPHVAESGPGTDFEAVDGGLPLCGSLDVELMEQLLKRDVSELVRSYRSSLRSSSAPHAKQLVEHGRRASPFRRR